MSKLPTFMSFSLVRFDARRPIEEFIGRTLETKVRYSTCRPDNLLIDGTMTPDAEVFCHFALCDDEISCADAADELIHEANNQVGIVESIQLQLRPYAHRGTLNWLDQKEPSAIFAPHGDPIAGKPVVSMTSGGYTESPETQMERVQRFIINTVTVGEDILAAEGLKFRRLFSPSVKFEDPITITVWDSEQHLSNYAYKPGEHLTRAKRQNEATFYFDRNSFTRFAIERAEGEWEGVLL